MNLNPIRLSGVRQNNLKNVSIEIPQGKMTVITGLSGSGKSTLAFDTLYAEGQRRYVESLSTYTRQFLQKMPKPDLDQIENIPPAIALEQRNTVLNSRSTVATQTELLDFLRLFFSKIGTLRCATCEENHRQTEVTLVTVERIKSLLLENSKKKKLALLSPLSVSHDTPTQKKDFASDFFSILRDQGFRRAFHLPTKTWHDFDEPLPSVATSAALTNGEWFLLIDRFNFGDTIDGDTQARFSDSIAQALRYGQERLLALRLDTLESKLYQTGFVCIDCNTVYPLPTPQLFSFNSPLGACQVCNGFGHTLDFSERKVFVHKKLTLSDGLIDPMSKPSMKEYHRALMRFCQQNQIRISKRFEDLTNKEKKLLWTQVLEFFKDLETQRYKFHIRIFIRRYQDSVECHSCHGSRLNHNALRVKVRGESLADLLSKPISDLLRWAQDQKWTASEKSILKDLYPQTVKRLEFLERVGVGYLTLNRLTRTLSGGEYQRINLATHLGNGLCGTLYVLDEPTIGLHAEDIDRLISILRELRDQGNTVAVVEHETQILADADWIIEMGPEAGRKGGEVVAMGTPAQIRKIQCRTRPYLDPNLKLTRRYPLRKVSADFISLEGCREHNLKNIDVQFPLHQLVVVTGVSGSGKTTLVHSTLARALENQINPVLDEASAEEEDLIASIGAHDQMSGYESISRLILLDQKPIGKNSRSNPATFLKAWDEIRKIYASQSLSISRGYTPAFFSFNVDGGRCPTCKGEGEVAIDMHFMAEVRLPCEDCQGKRFTTPLLDVLVHGKSIADLLTMTIDEAAAIYHDHPILRRKFSLLQEVGLGYIELGQPGPTLSGGEAQRLKIAAALDQEEAESRRHELFILDEPTTGLHPEDVDRLLKVLHHLVNRGKSVILIEHHLDVIANCDTVIDMGIGGGELGGHLIASGTPESLLKIVKSKTGQALKRAGFSVS